MVTTATLAELGALIGDPARAAMLTTLLGGQALTAAELASVAGIAPSTASAHLSRLLDAGLLGMERQGRHRYHRLASSEVAHLLETMQVAGASLLPRRAAPRTGPAEREMRHARLCYDHIAGSLGVALAEAVSDGETLRRSTIDLAGRRRLAEFGLDIDELANGRRAFCRPCLDWSERRHHLAGAVGAAILDRTVALGWLRRRAEGRALIVTPEGERGFRRHFGIAIAAEI